MNLPISSIERTKANQTVELIRQNNRAIDDFLFYNKKSSYSQILDRVLPPNKERNQNDAEIALACQLLGVETRKQDIVRNSIFPFPSEQLRRVKQDLDYFIIPDAGEQPTPDGKRSRKSLTVEAWDQIFQTLPKTKRVAILKGVAHPAYVDAVVERAKRAGLQIEIIEGNLGAVGAHMLRAKTIVGMDSGTTHLAVDAVRAAEQVGTKIKLKEIFKGYGGFFANYGVTDMPVLRADVRGIEDLGQLSQQAIDLIAEYILS